MEMENFQNEPESYINGLLSQDAHILKTIYAKNYDQIALYVNRLGGTREDAQDVFQDALVVVYRKAKSNQLKLNASFGAYLFGVCKKIWLKKQCRTKSVKTSPLDHTVNSETAELDLLIEKTEQYQLYREKFLQLEKKCQALLELFFKGFKMAEIAVKLGLTSEGYAKKRKFLCKKKLVALIQADERFQELKER